MGWVDYGRGGGCPVYEIENGVSCWRSYMTTTQHFFGDLSRRLEASIFK